MTLVPEDPSDVPLAIAAISPYRPGEPVEDVDGMMREATDCLAAGASIVHHHHDMRFAADEAVGELLTLGRAVLARHSHAILYCDLLTGASPVDRNAHLAPLARAGLLALVPVDPGAANSQLDEDGLPFGSNQVRQTFDDANAVAAMARSAVLR